MFGSTQLLQSRAILKKGSQIHHIRCSPVTNPRSIRNTSEVILNNPAEIPTTGEKNPILSEDRLRVNSAMKVKTDQIERNAENSTTNSEHIFGYSSVDFGNSYNLPHPIWSDHFKNTVKPTHRPPNNFADRLAHLTINTIRFNFDWMSGWSFGQKTPEKALNRAIFLESVAGIPGSVAGILRHLHSLRRLRRDNGWIHTLMEEAENERMHLLTFLELKKPGRFFRSMVWMSQGIFFNFFFFSYLINPTFCHRLVGYLEEQAVHTYTHILESIDAEEGTMKEWRKTPAPEIARNYWNMSKDATMRDVIAVIRADESHHRDVNHSFADLDSKSGTNPFKPGH
eukprot:TRINITY_DN9532_c0_g1_i1.p1 TRINITY_DN9532_c0_g1~~TRINITY_DN9532_c0_g1_i1.p1  ORF type:complete len:340 (+),score=65.24 TRINITY_DN9532_c0_g1_i1:43-1062(+)